MLLASTLVADPKTQALRSQARRGQPRSEPPSPLDPPPGCPFNTRCKWAADVCRGSMPPLAGEGARAAACHRLLEVNA
jgi:oligopeptide/dipeptide ABC transporter ATP-binding protein